MFNVVLSGCKRFLPAATLGAVRSTGGSMFASFEGGSIGIIDESVIDFGSGGVNDTYVRTSVRAVLAHCGI